MAYLLRHYCALASSMSPRGPSASRDRLVLVDPGTKPGRAELKGHLEALVEASISVQAKQSPPPPLFPP
jgi:hypothetical protein